jgi:hypothetical protein
MRNIHDWREKINTLLDGWVGRWGIATIIFLVALACFGLGRLSALEDAKPPVAIEQSPEAARPSTLFMGGLIVASRSGTAYYYPWCTGAGKILPANQVWFPSESAARQAGYTPAKACKGLGT